MKKYLIHQDNWNANQLKGKPQDEIEILYYIAYRKVQQFVPIEEDDTEKSPKRLKTVEEKPIEEETANEEKEEAKGERKEQ